MALTSLFSQFLLSTISFTDFELDIILDIDASVETSLRHRDIICFGNGIDFRKTTETITYSIIPGQDLIALQGFLPYFVRMIQNSKHIDLSEIAERGRISPTFQKYKQAFYYQNRTDLGNKIQLLQDCSVVESYLGRICFYRHKSDYILEVDKFSEPAETFFDIVFPQELISVLQETDRIFRSIVSEKLETIESRKL